MNSLEQEVRQLYSNYKTNEYQRVFFGADNAENIAEIKYAVATDVSEEVKKYLASQKSTSESSEDASLETQKNMKPIIPSETIDGFFAPEALVEVTRIFGKWNGYAAEQFNEDFTYTRELPKNNESPSYGQVLSEFNALLPELEAAEKSILSYIKDQDKVITNLTEIAIKEGITALHDVNRIKEVVTTSFATQKEFNEHERMGTQAFKAYWNAVAKRMKIEPVKNELWEQGAIMLIGMSYLMNLYASQTNNNES